jgi:sec-independent protein translocase protein TatA
MEGFGIEKILLILLIVLLLFGARRIPELAASMGKGIREFRKSLSDPDRGGRDTNLEATRTDAEMDRVAAPRPTAPATNEEARPDPKRLIQ